MVFNAKIPYNDLPPLPPEIDVETKTILKETIAARSALAELKGLGATIPNQEFRGHNTDFDGCRGISLLSRLAGLRTVGNHCLWSLRHTADPIISTSGGGENRTNFMKSKEEVEL